MGRQLYFSKEKINTLTKMENLMFHMAVCLIIKSHLQIKSLTFQIEI